MEVVSPIRWQHRPELNDPVLLTAFEGWNDAGDAASSALRWLADRHGAEKIGTIDCEDYFDFTSTRPLIEVDDDGRRQITWPDTEIWTATTDTSRDLVLVIGHEPHLRWRSYCAVLMQVVEQLGVSFSVTLGALLSDIPHSRPTVISGTSDDAEVVSRLDVVRSTYEGPTGIVGVLGAELRAAGVPSASLWASVPTYVSGAPSPKATLALIERTSALLGISLPTTDLEIASASYVRQIDELVAADDDTAAYVADLEEAADQSTFDDDLDDRDDESLGSPPLAEADAGHLVEEVERYLRGD